MKKKSNTSPAATKIDWTPSGVFQRLIIPLADRIRNRRRRGLAEERPVEDASTPVPFAGDESDRSPLPSASNEISLVADVHEELVAGVMKTFHEEGWEPVLPLDNPGDYDLELRRGKERVAVQVRSQKARVYLPQVRRLEGFLDSPEGRKFSRGFLVSSSGFARTVFAYLDSEGLANISLGTFTNGRLAWYPEEDAEISFQPKEKRYIGVFTCKGGVGKTTVSAHLAGAFALCGYHVVLLDLDRQGNLRKLMGEGIYLPHPRKKAGTTITVLDHHEWDEDRDPETGIVICDCNPEFSQNPVELMSRFDYCIIPTTLNPLGINKNGFIIRKTFQEIRHVNQKAEMFVLINNFDPKEEKRNQVLNDLMKREFVGLTALDSRCHYIDPEDVSVRFSKQLLYWGYDTVIDGAEPQLAFRAFGGRSLPRSDFLSLAEFLQNHTDLQAIKHPAPAKGARRNTSD
jgi:chromosome partitioning protein